MMTATAATLEMIDAPANTLSDLDGAVEQLVALQKRTSEIERQAKQLRGVVKAAMTTLGVRKFSTGNGHSATIIENTSWRGDRDAAEKLLPAEIVSAIFRPSFTTTLRIK